MRKQTPEHIQKKAAAKRRGSFFNCEVCNSQFWRTPSAIKKGNSRFCTRACYFEYQKGKPKKTNRKGQYVGENNPNWKGGITPANKKMRASDSYKEWRQSVFERDDWTCKKCGDRSGVGNHVLIQAHHLKPFATFPELRFKIDNGLTLCKKCHDKEPKGKEVYLIL